MRLIRRLAYWLRLRSHHDDLIDELAFHREMVERELLQRGLSPAAASTAARRAMGNETLMREDARAVWLWPSLEALWQDVTYTLRDLRRNPAFTAGVILTLALGFGANAAMFSLVDRLLFRAPAFMIDPASVHRAYLYRTTEGREREIGGPYARYRDIAAFSRAFSRTAAYGLRPLALGVGDATEVRSVATVSAAFFAFFDAPPFLGRYFTPDEDGPPDPAPVAVLSYPFWKTRLGGRRDIVGSTLQIDAVSYTIVGVAPDGFVGLWPYRPPAAFVPVAAYAKSRLHQRWATTYTSYIGLGMMVRRKPDVSVGTATADLTNAFRQSLQAQLQADGSNESVSNLRPRTALAPVLADRGPERSSAGRAATWLSGVTTLVLLIACANVVNLLLARAMRRRREIAVRIALGVTQRRLLGQLLTEGMVLSVLGGAGGVAIAVWGSGLLRATFLPDTERVPVVTDVRTLVFVALLALGVGMATGLAPLAQLRRHNLAADLKSGPRGARDQRGTRAALVLLQSALSVVLLVGAGLFVRSLANARAVRLGFDADSVLVVSLEMRDVKLDSAATAALRLRLLDAAASTPGVSHATLQEATPFFGSSSYDLFVAGIDSVEKRGRFDVNTVSADYFATMGTRILRGRGFESTDREGTRPVAVVGESMAAALWPGQDAIGKCIRVLTDTAPCREIVGVAEDIHSQTIDAEPRLFLYYLPATQWRPQEGGLFVRARGDARRLVQPLRLRLQQEMPGTAFVTITPLGDIVDGTMRSWIAGATVFTALGLLAVALAAVGLYSVIAYNVAQRRHELGVRLALGAARARIVRLVVAESLRFAVIGVAIGSAVALAAGRVVGPLLFRESPRDPLVFALVAGVLVAVAVVASWLPAWRAGGLDAKIALHSD